MISRDPAAATRERILDASIEAVTLYGLAKLSMSDVATRSQVSRPTLYKYFGSKDELIEAAVAREAAELVSRVLAAAEEHREAHAALEAALSAALRLTREHPLLDRIIRTEPEALLPYLATDRIDGDGGTGGAAVLLFVRTATEALIRQHLSNLDEVGARRLADMIARLLVSYAISAPDDPPELVGAAMASILLDGAIRTGEAVGNDPTNDRPATEQQTPGQGARMSAVEVSLQDHSESRGDGVDYTDTRRHLWAIGLAVPMLPLVSAGLVALTGYTAWWWLSLAFIYLLIPAADAVLGTDRANPPEQAVAALEEDRYYRWLTYLYLPLQYVSFFVGAWLFVTGGDSWITKLAIALEHRCSRRYRDRQRP